MRGTLLVLLTAAVALAVSGCGLSKEQIGKTVQTAMQTTFDTDPQFSKWQMTVTRVQVLRQGDNQFQGIATISHKGTSHNVPVAITVDGNNVAWKTEPGAFLFVLNE